MAFLLWYGTSEVSESVLFGAELVPPRLGGGWFHAVGIHVRLDGLALAALTLPDGPLRGAYRDHHRRHHAHDHPEREHGQRVAHRMLHARPLEHVAEWHHSPPDDGPGGGAEGNSGGDDGASCEEPPVPRRMVRYDRNRGPLQNRAPMNSNSREGPPDGGARSIPACLRMTATPRKNRMASRMYVTGPGCVATHDPPFRATAAPDCRGSGLAGERSTERGLHRGGDLLLGDVVTVRGEAGQDRRRHARGQRLGQRHLVHRVLGRHRVDGREDRLALGRHRVPEVIHPGPHVTQGKERLGFL